MTFFLQNMSNNNFYIEKINYVDTTKLELTHFNNINKNFKVFVGYDKPYFVTDDPASYFILLDCEKGYFYELNVLRPNIELVNDTFLVLYSGFNLQKSLCGWFKKDSKGNFLSIKNGASLIYENNLLWSGNSKNVLSTENPVWNLAMVDNSKLTNLNYKYLYKFVQENSYLQVSSTNNIDLISANSGLFYVPYPGIGVENIVSINQIILMIRTSNKSRMYF